MKYKIYGWLGKDRINEDKYLHELYDKYPILNEWIPKTHHYNEDRFLENLADCFGTFKIEKIEKFDNTKKQEKIWKTRCKCKCKVNDIDYNYDLIILFTRGESDLTFI